MTEPLGDNHAGGTPPRRSGRAPDRGTDRVRRDELDRLFDREMSADERRRLTARLRHDGRALDEVLETRAMIRQLRASPPTPDLTDAVLAGVGHRRGFLSARLRRRVRTGRWATAAMFLLALGAVALAHRLHPAQITLAPASTPVSDLGEAVQHDSAESRRRFEDAVMQMASVGLISETAPSGNAAAAVGPARLTAFHVDERAADTRAFAVLGGGAGPLLTSAVTDAETLALHHARATLASLDGGVFADGAASPGMDYAALAGLGQDGAVLGTPLARDAMIPDPSRWVAPGVLPLSASPSRASAFVGRLSGFRDRTAEDALLDATDRARRHPSQAPSVSKVD